MSSVAEIVADVRERGDEALREWALELDGIEPARAEPEAGLPAEAVLPTSAWRSSRASSSSGGGSRFAPSVSTFRAASSRLS